MEKAREAYELICRFLEFFNNRNKDGLRREFDIEENVHDEIYEALSGYFERMPTWTAPPLNFAFAQDQDVFDFDFYEMNEVWTWGAECRLWQDGERS
ncbi:hypothetical protein, partial [Nostoc linckia]|uniref:hypothetical protein n=1 Tax=Nostoc linckia TaxID=92942 RepID=UPI000C022F98